MDDEKLLNLFNEWKLLNKKIKDIELFKKNISKEIAGMKSCNKFQILMDYITKE